MSGIEIGKMMSSPAFKKLAKLSDDHPQMVWFSDPDSRTWRYYAGIISFTYVMNVLADYQVTLWQSHVQSMMASS